MQTRKIYIQSYAELADEHGEITIIFPDAESLSINEFWQSDEYDYSAEDLQVTFAASDIDLAIRLLTEHQEIDSLNFFADICSDSFEGKLRQSQLLVSNYGIYAEFVNDWTATKYQINLTRKLECMLTSERLLSCYDSPYYSLPNFESLCENKLKISGLEDEMVALKTVLVHTDGTYGQMKVCFSKLMPEPVGIPKNYLDNWRFDNWGTVNEPFVTRILSWGDTSLKVYFLTENDPAREFINHLIGTFTNCEIEYHSFSKSCDEAGFICNSDSVRADYIYDSEIERDYVRRIACDEFGHERYL